LRSGQYEDLDGAAHRILLDEDAAQEDMEASISRKA
jgi:cbb3-type cytochrome oxidase maturation protein